jgi:LysR family hydrogen peroxide-inducible transcriptional activator
MATLTQLEYLLALNKERHFARAAESCHVSQPSLSIQIQKLEEEYNVIIFDRSQTPILVTEVGAQIIEQAKIIINEAKKLSSIASEQAGVVRGDFHLAVIPTVAPYLIPLFLSNFSTKYPLVKLKISEFKTNDIIKMLLNDEIDAGLLSTPLHHKSLIERHLYFEPFKLFIDKKHELQKSKSITEAVLKDTPLWLLEEGHCLRSQVLQICHAGERNPILKNVEFSSGNLETLKNLVLQSGGATLLPDLATLNLSKKEMEINIRSFTGAKIPTREIGLICARSFYKETVLNALEACILDNLPASITSLKKSKLQVLEF